MSGEKTDKGVMPPDVAIAIILEGSGRHFDPALVDVFKRIADGFEKIAVENRSQEEGYCLRVDQAAASGAQ
jgi:HD-GYP domain-containing protein (c-di-GMP phosphodiesterase class II)